MPNLTACGLFILINSSSWCLLTALSQYQMRIVSKFSTWKMKCFETACRKKPDLHTASTSNVCTMQSCFKIMYLKNIHLPSFNITPIFLISASKLLGWVLYCCQHICFVVSDNSGHFNRHILSATKAFLLCGPFYLGPITALHGSKGAPSFHTYAEDQILQLPHVATNCCVQSRHPPEAH